LFDYWKNQYISRGFTPGGMFIKDKLCYVPIPKNSSSYIGQLLLSNGWGIANFLTSDLTDKKFIILLRDPIDRWISGMAQYMCSALLKNGQTAKDIVDGWNSLTQDLVFDRVIFDDHTEKQVYFINSIPEKNCIFFSSMHDPQLSIKNYLNLNSYDLNIDIEIDRNQSQGNEHKEILVKFLQDQLTNNPELVNKLINTYQEDLKLWKSIT